MEKSILENDKFSRIYTIAFSEPISKKKIAEKVTESGRKQYIIDKNIDCFRTIPRKDGRFGDLLLSDIEPLINLIGKKTSLTKDDLDKLSKVLDDKSFRSLVNDENNIVSVDEILHLVSVFALTSYAMRKRNRTSTNRKGALKEYNKATNPYYNMFGSLIKKPNMKESHVKAAAFINDRLSKDFTNDTLEQLIKVSELGEILAQFMVNMLSFEGKK